MAPFYPYFPSSTAPQPPITTREVTSPHPHHHNITEATRNGTHHHDSGLPCPHCGHYHDIGLPCPPVSTNLALNLPAPASEHCDGCEPPILPDLAPPSPATNHTCHNGTARALSELSQAQVEGPGYHSRATGRTLMVVLFVAGAAVALGAVYCVGRACWKYKMRRAEKLRVTSV
ncbi:hypothetical protein P171DRAFT_516746 [Karstenula rhodostoma CBS 690.94]|uniref:Uncharacterized protein n=1 Tax=Karstenula rhodostoma CBS 690.94 TaxID=1392251 RepID=A0A9P4PY40_9PLEO|nr:hypothetical protein P171DRAFT_516746 [Karstenula rhodostoma CBS 690.94]